MSRKFHLALIFGYLIVTIYFAVFNWGIFSVSLNVSLGFTVINIPVVALLFLLGLLLLILQWTFVKMNIIKQERDLTKKDNELMALEVAYYDDPGTGIKTLSENMKNLQEKVDNIIQSRNLKPALDYGKDAPEIETSTNIS